MSLNRDPRTHPLTIRGTLIKSPKPETIGEEKQYQHLIFLHTIYIVEIVSAVRYLTVMIIIHDRG